VKGFIICIGNRLVSEDATGLLVYDRLQAIEPLPAGIELIEGGLAGLNLLPLLEQGGRVVFVDAVHGFAAPGEIVLLDSREIKGTERESLLHFDHGAGLPYLLAVLPAVYEGELPEEIFLVGLEGQCSTSTLERAAGMSIAIAAHGLKGLG
jgi:hydrogenase maturation protease